VSKSPKYSAVRAGDERRVRLEKERHARERRRRAEEAARAETALAEARRAAGTRLAEISLHGRESTEALENVQQSLREASTVDKVSAALRRLDEIAGTAWQVARHAEQRRAAESLLTELGARLTGLLSDATETAIPLQELTLAGEAWQYIRSELDADRPHETLELAGLLEVRLNEIEQALDSAIERISARREMLASIVDALPTLGFSIEPDSFLERTDGSIGVQARRRTGEPLAVVVEDVRTDEYRVNYLRDTGAGGAVALGRKACSALFDVAEQLNESVRRTGFDAGALTWDGDDGEHPSARNTRTVRRRPESAARWEES
jgi:hypothetical protein